MLALAVIGWVLSILHGRSLYYQSLLHASRRNEVDIEENDVFGGHPVQQRRESGMRQVSNNSLNNNDGAYSDER